MGRLGLLFKIFREFTSIIHSSNALVYSITFLSVISVGFCITACSPDNTTSSWDYTTESRATREFMFNYDLLRFHYNDAKKYLGDPEDYIGKIKDSALAKYNVPWDYYDIYYMYHMMNDPHTQYVDPAHSVLLLDKLNSSEQKMDAGFKWGKQGLLGNYVITSVVKNSPADKNGLKAGDQIIAIEGVAPTNDIVFNRLSGGTSGDIITYTVKRDSQELILPIKLAPYYTPTVELTYKDSIPVIKILEFTKQTSNDSGTYGEFVDYLRETEKYRSTIIDLRDNGGGDGDQCFDMSKQLLPKGDSLAGVIEAGPDKNRNKQIFDTTFKINNIDGIAKDRYFVFLVNSQSASCSEVFLLSVTMNRKLPVVGTTTYGKGIGQNLITTPSFSLAVITALKVVDKKFNTYHKYGIEPDFIIYDDEQALNKAVELAKEMTYVRIAEYGSVNTGHFAKMAVEPDTILGFYFLPKN